MIEDAIPIMRFSPVMKSRVKDKLYKSIYGNLLNHYEDRIEEIIRKNVRLTKMAHPSFYYKGEVYISKTVNTYARKVTNLHKDLVPEMLEYLKDVNETNNKEMPYVLGYINQVLNASDSVVDYLYLFPEALHPPFKELADHCPCKKGILSEEEREGILVRNHKYIQTIRERMVKNLLIK